MYGRSNLYKLCRTHCVMRGSPRLHCVQQSVGDERTLRSWERFAALTSLEGIVTCWLSQTMYCLTALASRSRMCRAECRINRIVIVIAKQRNSFSGLHAANDRRVRTNNNKCSMFYTYIRFIYTDPIIAGRDD